MIADAASDGGLGRRRPLLAALLSLLSQVVGLAYVRRLMAGIAAIVLMVVVVLVGGRSGLMSTPTGFYLHMAVMAAIPIACAIYAFRIASATPFNAQRRWYNRWYHYLWIGALAVLSLNLLTGVRGQVFGYESYRIPSVSMEPTLRVGDYLFVDTRASTMTILRRDDLVTYTPAQYHDQVWIARIVGLPGERIRVADHRASINGAAINEPYLAQPDLDHGALATVAEITLGPDQYYLLGDNRGNVVDSRMQGPIPRTAILGKARHIWLSRPATGGIDTTRIGMLADTQPH